MESFFEKAVDNFGKAVEEIMKKNSDAIKEIERAFESSCKDVIYMIILYEFPEDLYDLILEKSKKLIPTVGDLNDIFFPGRHGLLMMLSKYTDDFHMRVAKMFLHRGLQIDNVDVDGYTALHYAVRHQNRRFLKFLLENGADANLPDELGNYPIMTAIMTGNIELTQILLQHNVNLNVCSDEGLTPLYLMIQKKFTDMVFDVIGKIKNINICTDEGFSILMIACEIGDHRVVKCLLKYEWDLNRQSIHGWNAMHYAASRGNIKVVELLYKHGMDINVLTNKKKPSLFFVHPDNIESFLSITTEIDIHYTTPAGDNILHLLTAHEKPNLYALELLIERGVNINQRNKTGNTPLHNACIHNQQYTVEILLRSGVIMDIPNNNGIYPCHICAIKHFVEILSIFYIQDPSLFYLEIDNQLKLNVYNILGLDEKTTHTFRSTHHYDELVIEVSEWIRANSRNLIENIALI
jgi:ankyrin repeat protein